MEKQAEYQPVDYDDPRTSSESEGTMLMGRGAVHLPTGRRNLRTAWQVVGAILFLVAYTPLVVLMTRRTVKEDPTYGGKIIKCEFTWRSLFLSLLCSSCEVSDINSTQHSQPSTCSMRYGK